jgi:hypothetical protein
VLASHPEVIALEERPTLNEGISRYFVDDRDIGTLMNASEAELEPLREAYWRQIRSLCGDVSGKVFIDKQPSLTLYLPLLKRLFPNARILFCIRDPRDVLLSCYRRSFAMNGTIYQFTDLESLAKFYSYTMDLAALYFEKLGQPVHRHVHETFVQDFEGETRRMCDFLGLAYAEAMRDFVETARKRDIRTPSAAQVREGLNASGVGYWKNYAKGLEPALPLLQRWVAAYGYA